MTVYDDLTAVLEELGSDDQVWIENLTGVIPQVLLWLGRPSDEPNEEER